MNVHGISWEAYNSINYTFISDGTFDECTRDILGGVNSINYTFISDGTFDECTRDILGGVK